MSTTIKQRQGASAPAVHRLGVEEYCDLVLSGRVLSRIRWLPRELLGLVDRATGEIYVIERTKLRGEVVFALLGENHWREDLHSVAS